MISARAELKAIDLEEIDLESKIRAGDEEIKLRATQDEKVKEEMKNLKAGTWRNGNDGVKSLDVESHRVVVYVALRDQLDPRFPFLFVSARAHEGPSQEALQSRCAIHQHSERR